jgi:tetratricopeptide (TPR) repeat protein
MEWNLGAEYWIWRFIVVRAGVEGNPALRQSDFGFGFKIRNMQLDVAQGLTDLGMSSRMGVSWKFGKSVIAKREDAARRLIQEGIASYQQGNFMLGLDRFNRSLDLDPTNNDVRTLTGRLSSVVSVMPSAVGEGDVPNIIRKAVQDYLKGDNRGAINALRYAYLEKDPTNEKLLQLLNRIEKEAREKITERVDQRKKGFSYIDQKLYDALQAIYDAKYDKSIILLQEVLDLDPQNIEAMKRLGSAFFLIEQKAQAKEVWQRAMELDPTDTTIQTYLQQIP